MPQTSAAIEAAALDAKETAIGVDAILEIRTGAQPANCAAASTGTLLARCVLPSDWMANASGRTKAKSGTWQDLDADASGTPRHYRIFESTGTTCHMQGTCGAAGTAGGGNPELVTDVDAIVQHQVFSVVSFTWTAGNA